MAGILDLVLKDFSWFFFVLDGSSHSYCEPIYDLTQNGDVIPGK